MKLSEAKFYPVYDGEESLDDIFDMEIVEMDEDLTVSLTMAGEAVKAVGAATPCGAGVGA